jgi:hypothetical protein
LLDLAQGIGQFRRGIRYFHVAGSIRLFIDGDCALIQRHGFRGSLLEPEADSIIQQRIGDSRRLRRQAPLAQLQDLMSQRKRLVHPLLVKSNNEKRRLHTRPVLRVALSGSGIAAHPRRRARHLESAGSAVRISRGELAREIVACLRWSSCRRLETLRPRAGSSFEISPDECRESDLVRDSTRLALNHRSVLIECLPDLSGAIRRLRATL